MKAYEILMMLIIFNFIVWMFGLMSINPSGISAELIGVGAFDIAILLAGLGVAAGTTFLLGADITILTFVYATFGTTFINLEVKSVIIIQSLLGSAGPAGDIFLLFFTAITSIIFVIGFIQMASGGWKSYV